MTLNSKYKARPTGAPGFYLVIERGTGKFIGNLQRFKKGWTFSQFTGTRFKYRENMFHKTAAAAVSIELVALEKPQPYLSSPNPFSYYGVEKAWAGDHYAERDPKSQLPSKEKKPKKVSEPLDCKGVDLKQVLGAIYGKTSVR